MKHNPIIKGNKYYEVEIGGKKYGVEPFWVSSAEGSLPLETRISNNGNPDGYNIVPIKEPMTNKEQTLRERILDITVYARRQSQIPNEAREIATDMILQAIKDSLPEKKLNIYSNPVDMNKCEGYNTAIAEMKSIIKGYK